MEEEQKPRFQTFWIEDINRVSGHRKRRKIYSPNAAMRVEHAELLRFVRGLQIDMPNATGCVPQASPLKNVLRHRRPDGIFPRYFYLIDLSKAYDHASISQLADILSSFRPGEILRTYLHEVLESHCISEEGGLATGGPASADLFNLYCEVKLDRRLREIAEYYGITYTRYLDDLTFSSDVVIGVKKRRAIRRNILSAGFAVNHGKAKVIDLAKDPLTINGVGITLSGRYFLPRPILREIKGILERACRDTHGVSRSERSWIHGKMGLFKALTDCLCPNKTEQRVLALYEKFKQQLG